MEEVNATVAPVVAPTEGRVKRERKAVSRMVPEVEVVKVVQVPTGSGTELGSLEYFCGMMEKYKDDDEPIRALHLLLTGSVGKKGHRKKMLKQFNGFSDSVNSLQIELKMSENKKKWNVTLLKDVSRIFGLDAGGSRAELIKRIAEYTVSPYETKNGSSLDSKKRKKSATGKKTKKSRKTANTGEPKKKRPMGAYMLYCNSVRAGVKAENPGETLGGLSKIIGAMWRELDSVEKESWQAQAAALKDAAGECDEVEANQEDEQEEDQAEDSQDELVFTSEDEAEGNNEEEGGDDEEEEA